MASYLTLTFSLADEQLLIEPVTTTWLPGAAIVGLTLTVSFAQGAAAKAAVASAKTMAANTTAIRLLKNRDIIFSLFM
jgi:hypothetical protein